MTAKTLDKFRKSAIPVVDFYGEATSWPVADFIHCEPLHTRSARHNWEIQPHRHNGLVQIVYIEEGYGEAQVDSEDIAINAPGVLIIPDMCVHKFSWKVDSKGMVLFIAKPLLLKLSDQFGSRGWGENRPAFYSTATSTNNYIDNTFTMIGTEYHQNNSNRGLLLETLITSFCIWLSRKNSSSHNQEHRRRKPELKYDKFLLLLEEHFKEHHLVNWYAKNVGVSAPHLNNICQKIKQQSALAIIQERLLTEAQRNLIYTGLTAAEISHQLGFTEPSYFNRFFKRKTQITPLKFRELALQNNRP